MPVKRFIVHQLYITRELTLFGEMFKHKWKKVSTLCFTHHEARYYLDLLEKADKFKGAINTYRIVCIGIT